MHIGLLRPPAKLLSRPLLGFAKTTQSPNLEGSAEDACASNQKGGDRGRHCLFRRGAFPSGPVSPAFWRNAKANVWFPMLRKMNLSFPKIISERNNDAVQ